MLKEAFIDLVSSYTNSEILIAQLWAEVEKCYSDKKRHYHTLQHLHNLLNDLIGLQPDLENWHAVLFALYYHDIIYNPLKSDNEVKSSALAESHMKNLSVADETITRCKGHILATKSHIESPDTDTNFFTDADLAVLGAPWDIYSKYYQDVRKEYSIYPDLIYNPGRKKVLKHFLEMNRIFKTGFFYDRFEVQARQNLVREIDML
jgi:predicted metal-dependent HD superfamily phosphohydrolase